MLICFRIKAMEYLQIFELHPLANLNLIYNNFIETKEYVFNKNTI